MKKILFITLIISGLFVNRGFCSEYDYFAYIIKKDIAENFISAMIKRKAHVYDIIPDGENYIIKFILKDLDYQAYLKEKFQATL